MWTWRLERALFPPAKVAEVKHDWVPLERISRELQLAVIAAEDQRFADHQWLRHGRHQLGTQAQPAKQAGARRQYPEPADGQELSSCGAIAASCARG